MELADLDRTVVDTGFADLDRMVVDTGFVDPDHTQADMAAGTVVDMVVVGLLHVLKKH